MLLVAADGVGDGADDGGRLLAAADVVAVAEYGGGAVVLERAGRIWRVSRACREIANRLRYQYELVNAHDVVDGNKK